MDPAAGLQPEEYRYTPSDEEAYGEGWFYLAQLDDGTFFFCNFFITNIGIGDNKGDLDVNVNFPDGTNVFDRAEFAKGALETSTERFFVKIGNSYISGSYPDFKVHIELDKVKADLDLHSELPGWRPNSGHVYFGKEKKRFYAIRAGIPRARITGSLEAAGRKKTVSGYAYSDHGWTNMYPHHYSSLWYSLRSFDPSWTVHYLEFYTPEKTGSVRVPWILIGKDGKILHAGTNFTLEKKDVVADPESNLSYPKTLVFEVNEPGFKARGTVNVQATIESIDLLAKLNPIERLVASFFARSFIYRQRDVVEVTITTPEFEETVKLPGVNEVLYVR